MHWILVLIGVSFAAIILDRLIKVIKYYLGPYRWWIFAAFIYYMVFAPISHH